MAEWCTECGFCLPEGSLFCPACGAEVEKAELQDRQDGENAAPAEQPEQPAAVGGTAGTLYPLLTNVGEEFYDGSTKLPTELRHVFLFLEDGDWTNAARYLIWAEDKEPGNPYLLLAKTMSELMIHSGEELKQRMNEAAEEETYQRFLQLKSR